MNAVAHLNAARRSLEIGQAGTAIAHLHQAIRLKGDMPAIHDALALAFEQTGRLAEAELAARNAIALRPGFAEAHHHLGRILWKSGRLCDAAGALRAAVQLKNDYGEAFHDLAAVLMAIGELDEAIACHRRLTSLEPRSAAALSALLYTLHYSPEYDSAALAKEHRAWETRFGQMLAAHAKPHANVFSADRRLKVGYVSPDFRDHTVPRFNEPALTHYDCSRFEVVLYSDVARPDATTARLRALGHAWRDIAGLGHDVVAEIVRRDRIDILVDLRGHGADNRLPVFALKPAPVQVSMVGYFNTTGLSAMTHRITDEHQDPPGLTERLHTEQLIRLPGTCWCYRPDDDSPDVSEPPRARNGHVTFGCLNKTVKLSPPCAALWGRVMREVPDSRLLLATPADCHARVRERLRAAGLPTDRVDFVGVSATRAEYLAQFARIDIALDPFPFNGITTTCDGLWMGVPHVSLAGSTSVARAGASILHGAGLGEWVARTPDEFIAIVSRLAADADRNRILRLGQRDRLRNSRLTDQAGFTRELESAFLSIWQHRCRAPAIFHE